MDIQETKKKMQSLYEELKKEAEGKFTSTGVYLSPSAISYCKKAKELVDEAIKYSEFDKNFTVAHVLHTLNKEVSYVENYDGRRKSEKKQRQELETLMREATHQLYVDLCPLVKDN